MFCKLVKAAVVPKGKVLDKNPNNEMPVYNSSKLAKKASE